MEDSAPLWSNVRRPAEEMPDAISLWDSDQFSSRRSITKLVCECLGLGRASARKDSLFRVGLLKLLFCRARDRTTRAGPLYGKGVRVCDRMMQASFGGKSSSLGFPWQLAKDCLLRRAPRTVEEDSREGLRGLD